MKTFPKIIVQLIATLGVIAFLLLPLQLTAMAQAANPGIFPSIGDPSSYGLQDKAPSSPGSATSQFGQLVYSLIQNVRYILGAVAIAVVIWNGFRMLTGWGDDGVYSKAKSGLLYGVIGLAVVGLAGELSTIFQVGCPDPIPGQPIVPCTTGGFLKDPNAILRANTLFNQRTKIIITFIKYLIGSIAVLEIVINGIRMIALGSSEDKLARDKTNLMYSAIGLVVIVIADNVINNVFYKINPSTYPGVEGVKPGIDAPRAIQELVGFTNLIVSIVGPIAILAVLAGGVMYMTAAGDDGKMSQAKRLIVAALAGIILMYGAFAIVSTFIVGNYQA